MEEEDDPVEKKDTQHSSLSTLKKKTQSALLCQLHVAHHVILSMMRLKLRLSVCTPYVFHIIKKNVCVF